LVNFAAVKIVLTILGLLSLVLGVVGIFLPLLPTTPLLLLSAWCFIRSSTKLYDWLLSHPYLGKYIRNFREHRAIPLRVKFLSVTMVWLTIGYCIVAIVSEYLWAQLLMFVLAVAVTWRILSYATLKEE
jgi:uncharacterized membrane protein YbaN (DUF454 family)